MTALEQAKPVVLFDGVCKFCNGSVNFLLRRKHHDRFLFAALQSPSGQALLEQHALPLNEFDSLVLVDDHGYRTRSTAVLHILRILGGPWRLLYALVIIPRPLRDWAYDLVAGHRYQWFGKRETCMVPTPEQSNQFLD